MKSRMAAYAVVGFVASGMAMGQATAARAGSAGTAQQSMPAPAQVSGPAGEVQGSYGRIKANLLKAAEKMPAADYGSKPTPEVRTFARVVNHVSEAQFHSCGAANRTAEAEMGKVPEDAASKDAVIAGLKASFAECDKAYAAATDATMLEMLDAGKGKRSRAGLLWGNVSHDNEQYATLALYLRIKGLVPPSSEK